MKTHNTPSIRTLPVTKPAISGKELLYKLEDDYRDYREACENHLCKSDPKIHAEFQSKIVAANQ